MPVKELSARLNSGMFADGVPLSKVVLLKTVDRMCRWTWLREEIQTLPHFDRRKLAGRAMLLEPAGLN